MPPGLVPEPGGADRSYGIHVARLAGLPERVLARAAEVLHELESERTVEHLTARRGRSRTRVSEHQLGLFAPGPHPLAERLAALDLDQLAPLEALNLIAAWKREWGAS